MCHIPAVPEVSLDSLTHIVLTALPTSIQGLDKTPNWKWLPQDTSTTNPETGDLKSLEKIIMAIIDSHSNRFSLDVTFQIARRSVPLAPSHDPFHPKEFFYLGRYGQGSSEVSWAGIVIPIECDSPDNKCNETNVNARVMYSMHHVMHNDPRRQLVLGLMCENTKARLWYHSRCRIVCSEEFDVNKDWSQLVCIVLSVVLALLDKLGIDPDMELVPAPHPDTKPSYNITIRNSDTGEATRYRTLDMISNETGKLVSDLHGFYDIFTAVDGGLKGVRAMHLCKYVHRDISTRNILLVSSGPFGRRGVLADLEYVKKIDDPKPPHDVKTGTAGCMATEVGYMKHFRLQEFRRPQASSLDLDDADLLPCDEPKPLPPFRHNQLHDLESIWWVCSSMLLYLAPVGQDSSEQLETFHQVFFNTDSKHEFICDPIVFRESTTHLKEMPSFVGLMERWAALLNRYYEIAYRQQDASEANLERIQIDDEIVERAYDRAQEILERLKQACKSLSTHFVSLEGRSYDGTSTTITEQSANETRMSVTEPRKGGFSTLATKRRRIGPAASHKKGSTGKTPKGLKREAPVESRKKQKGNFSVKAASCEPDSRIELPVRKKARTKHNDKVC
ncbi:unnamed protein product [Rhizoctonia solani]|uniref:Fungal-type protein kinase domain-containing protein n=1 Tax=Rhizoctonia solani TaxID=456999 RepID=A0A8H3H0G4_9AGAM|nr:unnamed protein product [Rhizoctonia solani]